MCAGLAAAHERGVLHHDLKPANVMIDGEGHVRITDFGLAAVVGAVDDVRAGTPAYMAPEQLAGKEVTPRSDIYALGLVLFELFTGKRVFEAKTLNELLALHESGALTTPSSHVRDLEPTIERAILRCLERDLGIAIQIVGIVVLLKILVRRTWLVLLLSTVVVLPIAMNGTFAGEELALELTISDLCSSLA